MATAAPLVTRQHPACFCCGDIRSPDYGSVFVRKTPFAFIYSFDRAGMNVAVGYGPEDGPPPIGGVLELHNRSFKVAGEVDGAAYMRALWGKAA